MGMGSGKCDEAAIASESAETSRAQDCGLTAVLLGGTKDSHALESPAVHLLNFCPNQGPLASFATRGEFQYPSGFRASLQGLVMMETASGCRKYMHSALQIGPDDEILPWKSNSAHTHRHTHTHTHTHTCTMVPCKSVRNLFLGQMMIYGRLLRFPPFSCSVLGE